VVAALLVGAGLAWWATSGATAQDEDALARGAELYQRNCAVCHSSDGSGIPGVAPPITEFSAPRVDLSMRTGRMPLSDPTRGVQERSFTAEEREATMAYLRDALDLEGEVPDPPSGEAAVGREIYAVNCAQCHGAAGDGGVAGDGVEIPHVVGLDETTVAASIREGPFAMPRFGEELITDEEVGHITAFLDEEVHEPTTPLGMASVDPFEVIFFAALLIAGVLLVSVWAGGLRGRRPAPPPGEETTATEEADG
jgi:ubiquinol-cytochrome c reductase cytochrome c subunit